MFFHHPVIIMCHTSVYFTFVRMNSSHLFTCRTNYCNSQEHKLVLTLKNVWQPRLSSCSTVVFLKFNLDSSTLQHSDTTCIVAYNPPEISFLMRAFLSDMSKISILQGIFLKKIKRSVSHHTTVTQVLPFFQTFPRSSASQSHHPSGAHN